MKWLERITNTTVPLSNYTGEAWDSWKTCAVGEARDAGLYVHVRGLGFVGTPDDDKLDKLGLDFGYAVGKNQRARALRVYLAIQRRLAQLAGLRVR